MFCTGGRFGKGGCVPLQPNLFRLINGLDGGAVSEGANLIVPKNPIEIRVDAPKTCLVFLHALIPFLLLQRGIRGIHKHSCLERQISAD